MKNSDHEYIKQKIENCGVSAPAEMDEAFVLDRIADVQPDPTPVLTEVKPKKHHYALISGIAAAFVAIVALTVVGAILINRQNNVVTETELSISSDVELKTFSSYDEVKMKTKEIELSAYSLTTRNGDMWVEEEAAGSNKSMDGAASDSSGSSTGGSGSGSQSFSETYKQVEGVDEADIVKTDGRYIYVADAKSGTGIAVYTASGTPERVATIRLGNSDDPTGDVKQDDEYGTAAYIEELYLHDGKLIAVGMMNGKDYSYDAVAAVYDVSDINRIRLVDQFHQSGGYSTSRMIGDSLYLVSEHYVSSDDFEIPVCYRGAESKEIPIENVCCVEHPAETSMLIVGGYDLSDGSEDVRSAAVLGTIEDVYCNETNMYIYATDWNVRAVVDYDAENDGGSGDSILAGRFSLKESEIISTDIYKVSLKDGISFTASCSVKGRLDSRYSLDERNGYLRVAATVEDAYYNQSNCLYILDSDLKEVGSVTGFAKDESIKAVRYVGDVAYVITYEQTDPLFVIDLSDPTKPVIMGEVKIDGFSTMLIPVDENTILGVGVYTENASYTTMQVQNGVKLALFDVSDKLHPKVLDEKSYRGYESEAVYEPRAFVYNPDRGDYLIPLNIVDYKYSDSMEYEEPDIRGGALNFKVENGRIVEIARPEVKTSQSDNALIQRCLYVGDMIYLVSDGYSEGVAVYAVKYQ